MFVPAVAFAWWLVALPMKTLPAALLSVEHATVASDAPAESGNSEPVEEADPASTERVPLRGPIPLDVLHMAQTFLDLPMGAERMVRLHDCRYVFVLEWHYHPRGFVGAPTGWHKGVTVYLAR